MAGEKKFRKDTYLSLCGGGGTKKKRTTQQNACKGRFGISSDKDEAVRTKDEKAAEKSLRGKMITAVDRKSHVRKNTSDARKLMSSSLDNVGRVEGLHGNELGSGPLVPSQKRGGEG